MRRTPLLVAVLLVGSALWARPAAARQDDRAADIQAAAAAFDFQEAVELLVPVLDPGLAGQDSLWAAAVKTLATVLLDAGLENARPDADLAAVLLRWGVRHRGAIPLDPVYDLEAVRTAYDRVASTVGEDPDSIVVVATEWDWAGAFAPAAEGRLAVAADAEGTASVTVDGRALGAGGTTTLGPGTYQVRVAVEGYEPLTVEREVLPGVTTRLTVTPAPLLAAAVRDRAATRLLQLSYGPAAARVCANGLALGPTSLAVAPDVSVAPGLERVGVPAAEAGVSGVRRAPDGDLAVVRPVVALALGPGPAYAAAVEGAFAWALYRDACAGPVRSDRVRLAAVDATSVRFDRPLAAAAVGGALVDRSGAYLGMVAAPDRATVFTTRVQAFVEEAIIALNAEAEASAASAGGGLPWKWIGGIGGAGALAAVLLSGGTTPPPPPPPTTGGITINLPG